MEKQLAFLKRHGFVIAGVGLPLLVILAFSVARLVPRYLVADPLYDVVYSSAAGYSEPIRDLACELTPVEGRLRVRWTRSEQPVYAPQQRVFRFDAAGGELVELTLPEPDGLKAVGDTQDFFLEGLEGVRLELTTIAPDGYEFTATYSGGGGLFGELFYGGHHGPRTMIHKDGRRIEVPRSSLDAYDYGAVRLLGWAVPLEEGR